jgi:hypothetical protein
MMNERIQELVKQADKLSLRYANENNVNHVDAFNIVFAELIVRECAAMTRNLCPHGELAEKAVKEHFGVEE